VSEAVRHKANSQARDLRHIAEMVERLSIVDASISTFRQPRIVLASVQTFDRVMRGRQINLTYLANGSYYSARGELEGVAIECYAYRKVPDRRPHELLCICGEPEIEALED
jgi:hypothetical protein